MASPTLIVTAPVHTDEGHPRVRLMRAYLVAAERAGFLPLVAPPLHHTTWAGAVLDRGDALLLTGGEDVDPSMYRATAHEKLGDVSRERDSWEIALVREARTRRLPTLAICRGIQLANVAFGGTLIQDIPSERPSDIQHAPTEARHFRSHALTIEPGSRAALAAGARTGMVNSIHHQAVDRVAPDFHVTGQAPDGIIEAIEPIDPTWWMLGVQWHPEELDGTPEGLGMFNALAQAVRTR